MSVEDTIRKAEGFAAWIQSDEVARDYPHCTAEAMIWLLRQYADDLRIRQKETPDSQKPGAEGGNCK